MIYEKISNFKPPYLPKSKFKIGDKAKIITSIYVGCMAKGNIVTIDHIYREKVPGVSGFNHYSMYFQENWLEKIE